MRTKQITVQSSWFLDRDLTIEVTMTIRISIPGDPYADVTTGLLFQPELPDHQQEVLHRPLYDGVHEGLAYVGLPLPSEHLAVDITELSIAPVLDAFPSEEHIQHLVQILGGLTRELVAHLWHWMATMMNYDDQSAT